MIPSDFAPQGIRDELQTKIFEKYIDKSSIFLNNYAPLQGQDPLGQLLEPLSQANTNKDYENVNKVPDKCECSIQPLEMKVLY